MMKKIVWMMGVLGILMATQTWAQEEGYRQWGGRDWAEQSDYGDDELRYNNHNDDAYSPNISQSVQVRGCDYIYSDQDTIWDYEYNDGLIDGIHDEEAASCQIKVTYVFATSQPNSCAYASWQDLAQAQSNRSELSGSGIPSSVVEYYPCGS
ncbi:MAG: hypothetical protein R3A11_07035 [Bdellovibrionota bacterium]